MTAGSEAELRKADIPKQGLGTRTKPAMPPPAPLLTTTCDIYRPFGAASPAQAGVPCRLAPSRFARDKPDSLMWTHTLDLQPGTDVRDATSRPPAVRR